MSKPPVIPDHTLLRAIGRGAYGEVWLARNIMGSLRAVKVISRNQFESEGPYEREFAGIRRYEPVSRASGGLVHVLQVGRNHAEGYFYYVMELADDAGWTSEPSTGGLTEPSGQRIFHDSNSYSPRTLRSELKRVRRLPTDDCLRLALDVTSGLAQLHRHGLVHRDVKPGNIIYVNGRAKLADIGLITAEGESRTFVGTEGYIPPEGPGSPSADLYALGIVLYQASTGLPPERFPDIPPDWLANADRDDAFEFHEIVLKACEGQRARRYQNVEQLQADLALLQSGQSVRHVRALQRRYARLRLVGIAGTALLLCTLGAAFLARYRESVAAQSRAKEAALREQIQRSLTRTEAAEREARQQLYTALLEQARATARSRELGQRVRALDAIRRAASISNTAELRGAALAAIALPDMRFEKELPKPTETTLLSLDPSFERLAFARGTGPVEIASVKNGQRLGVLPASTNLPTFLATWSSNGRYLAVKRDRTHDGQVADIEVWEISGPRRVLLLQNVAFGAVAFHPRLPMLISAQPAGALTVWDLERGNESKRFTFEDIALLLRYSTDGERFAVAYATAPDRFAVSVHLAGNGERLASRDYANFVAELAWHPDGHWLATADRSGAIRLLDSETGETRLVGRHNAQAAFVAFSPDGAYLLSGGWERELICWNVETMQAAFTLGLNSFRAQFKTDASECAVITDTAVQRYAFEHPSGRREFPEDLGPRLHNAAFSADGHWVAASGTERLGVWDLTHAGPGALVTNGADARLFFSSQGELFASRDDHCFRWHLIAAGDERTPPQLESRRLGSAEELASLCLVSNQLIFTGPHGTRVMAPDTPVEAEPGWVETVRGIGAVSPDARWVGIYQPYSTRLHVYRLPGLEKVVTLTNRAFISGLDFSPSGDELAVDSFRGVELWKTATWTRADVLTNSLNLFYAPDGRSCWITRDSRTSELRDARSLELLLPLPPGTIPLAVSPDGRYLAASTDARRLQLWDLAGVKATLKELGLEW